ncbi:hypothetical protein [Thermogymnomonas acidicola]|uniref:molybdenum cofactor guanylyltransferase n=1 Tax=Thermogymnomonas acidicola TaxID=399579 RepID=UPI001396CC6F|nr:hypothetical protein [Thermogymnomonas acidicola]
MIAVIPVKWSSRLPGKHMLPLRGRPIVEIVYRKVSDLMDCVVLSKYEVSVPYEKDRSENILDLVSRLMEEYSDGFMLIGGGDMPFFLREDIATILRAGQAQGASPTTPVGPEPMFTLYRPCALKVRRLSDYIVGCRYRQVSASSLSPLALFNVNTPEDYLRARAISSERPDLIL